MTQQPEEPDFDPAVYHRHFQTMPRDAELMGLDRNTEEGAMIAMAGSLSSAKASHRIVAWVIVGCLTMPLILTLVSFVF